MSKKLKKFLIGVISSVTLLSSSSCFVSADNSEYLSSTISVTESTASAKTNLAKPTGIQVSAKTNSVTIKWKKVSGASKYRVYMYNSTSKKFEVYKRTPNTKITINDLESFTTYKFKIAALDKNGNEGTKTGVISVTTDRPKPAVAPTPNESNGFGTVSGNITYKYNNYRGNVSDTGAKVLLIPKNISDGNIDYIFISENTGVFETKVDGTGTYNFNHVPAGEYVILIISKNTTDRLAFEVDNWENHIFSRVNSYLENNVTFSNFFIAFNKYDVSTITIYKGENTTYSYDFGITYI